MSPPERAPSRKDAWKILALLSTLAFVNYLHRSLIFPLLAPMAADLGYAPSSLGRVATAFDVVYACAAPIVGIVSDRIERKRVLVVGLVVWSLATGLTGAATAFGALVLMRGMTGLGEGGYFPTALSVIGDAFPARFRSRAIAIHGGAATLGAAFGYAFAGLAGERWGWRAPFLLSAVPGLVLAVVVTRSFVEPARAVRAHARAPRPGWRHARRILATPAVLWISIATCLTGFTMNGVATFLPLFLTERHGVPVGRAGVLVGAVIVIMMVGQLSGGSASDHFAARMPGGRPLFVAVGYLAVAPAMLLVARGQSVAVVLAGYAVSQLLRGLVEPSVYGTVLDACAPDERGSAQGLLIAFSFVGSSAAGAGVGAIVDAYGFSAAFVVLAVTSVLAATSAGALYVHLRRMPARALA